jgi:hypothetical protein
MSPRRRAFVVDLSIQRGLLVVARERAAATELLGFRRMHRLERVHGSDVRDPVDQLRQVPRKLSYQVGLCASSAPSTLAAIARSIETPCRAATCGALPDSAAHGS